MVNKKLLNMVEGKHHDAKPPYDRKDRICPMCDGSGVVADYIGLEMKPVGVECDRCNGTGKV